MKLNDINRDEAALLSSKTTRPELPTGSLWLVIELVTFLANSDAVAREAELQACRRPPQRFQGLRESLNRRRRRRLGIHTLSTGGAVGGDRGGGNFKAPPLTSTEARSAG